MRHFSFSIILVALFSFGCDQRSTTSTDSDSFVQDMSASDDDSGLIQDSEFVPDADSLSLDASLPLDDAEVVASDADSPSIDAGTTDMGSAEFINRSGSIGADPADVAERFRAPQQLGNLVSGWQVIYVDEAADTSGSGTSEAPVQTLSEGLDAAGETPSVVVLAPGEGRGVLLALLGVLAPAPAPTSASADETAAATASQCGKAP